MSSSRASVCSGVSIVIESSRTKYLLKSHSRPSDICVCEFGVFPREQSIPV